MTDTIGNRYLLVKKIGNGGMADVYLAMDTVLNREVAIKILRGDLSSDPVALLRFQREANAASGLQHSGIVDVFDVGEDDGKHYIVMEVVRGTTLKTLIHRRGALDKHEAVAIMKQLAEALAVAHHRGIIHRDIKPQNVLVKDDGTVKITDFGIALAEDAIQLTKHDAVMGSVHYMAPELSRGEGASPQSDIYALGVVFYELLSGDVPYRGDNPVEIAMKHMRDPFPSLHKFNPSIPNTIINIIAKATHKNRIHRYANIDALLEDLNRALDPKFADEPLWEANQEDDEGTKMIDQLHTVANPIDSKKAKQKKMILYGSIAAVVLALGIALFLFLRPQKNVEIVLPDLKGKTLQEATEIIDDLGLNLNPNITYSYSDELDTGIVISSRPGKDAKLQKGDQVRLTVSHGLNFVVEDYAGKTEAEVRALFVGKNVTIRTEKVPDKDLEPGIVIRQEGLNPGDKINPNQNRTLTLYVSSRVELQIPANLYGMGLDEAESTLTNLGITVVREELSQEGLKPNDIANLKYGIVVRSNPAPGSYYIQQDGSFVTIYYYLEKEKPVEPEKPTQKPDDKPDDNNDSSGVDHDNGENS